MKRENLEKDQCTNVTMTEPGSLPNDERRQLAGELNKSSSGNVSDDGHVSTQPKVDTLADTIESPPEAHTAKVPSDRISTSDETVPTPSKLWLIYPKNTLPKLTQHFPKRTIARKSVEKTTIGRSDSADIFLNHETMARQTATLIVDTHNPHQFLIENLSARKFIEIKNGRHSKILKAGNVEILKNKVQVILDKLQFTVFITPGDVMAPYYEIDVKSESNVTDETHEKLPLQDGIHDASSVAYQQEQYISALASSAPMPGFYTNVSLPDHYPTGISPHNRFTPSPVGRNASMPLHIPLPSPTYYPPGATQLPVDIVRYRPPFPPGYTETPMTPFPVQVASPTGSVGMASPQYYPHIDAATAHHLVSPHIAANQLPPRYTAMRFPVQDTQPHTSTYFY